MYQASEKALLKNIATDSIAYGLEHGEPLFVAVEDLPEALQRNAATFVTLLDANGELRGCIGSLEAHRPLATDIAHNAFAAAFSDPRFPPLTATENNHIVIKISILTPAQPITFHSEEALITQLRPHVDGLILEDRGYRGTFLPSVWETLPSRHEFFNHLKLKAGLPIDYWSDTLKVYRYTSEVIE